MASIFGTNRTLVEYGNMLGAAKTVLLIEDEALIRMGTSAMLEDDGASICRLCLPASRPYSRPNHLRPHDAQDARAHGATYISKPYTAATIGNALQQLDAKQSA
jgi:CheY-like chemotaxis protein